MATNVTNVLDAAVINNLFIDVDIKEVTNQAVVIASCVNFEGNKKTLGIKQVDGRLNDAVNIAMARAVAAFLGETLEEEDVNPFNESVEPSEPNKTEALSVEEAVEIPKSVAVDIPEDVKDIPNDVSDDIKDIPDDVKGIPDDIRDIPDDIPDEFIAEEEFNVAIDNEASIDAAETVTTNEVSASVTAEAPVSDTSDFELTVGAHQFEHILASEAVAKILAGDEKEIKSYNAYKNLLNFAKSRPINEKVREQAERFIEYAMSHGVTI